MNINVIAKHSMELESSTVDSKSNSAILNINNNKIQNKDRYSKSLQCCN